MLHCFGWTDTAPFRSTELLLYLMVKNGNCKTEAFRGKNHTALCLRSQKVFSIEEAMDNTINDNVARIAPFFKMLVTLFSTYFCIMNS